MAAFHAGQWLAKSEGTIDNYWRVIDVDGRVPDEFNGGGLGPRTVEEARAWLRREGVPLDADDRAIGGRFHSSHWDGTGTSQSVSAAIEHYGSDLPTDIGGLQALAANKLAPAQAVAVNLARYCRSTESCDRSAWEHEATVGDIMCGCVFTAGLSLPGRRARRRRVRRCCL